MKKTTNELIGFMIASIVIVNVFISILILGKGLFETFFSSAFLGIILVVVVTIGMKAGTRQ